MSVCRTLEKAMDGSDVLFTFHLTPNVKDPKQIIIQISLLTISMWSVRETEMVELQDLMDQK